MINNNNHRKNTRWSIFRKNYKTLRDLIVMQISMRFVIRKYEFRRKLQNIRDKR